SRSNALGPYLHARPNRRQLPYFFNLGVSNCDATIRPISLPVQRAQVGEVVFESVDHDGAAGPRTQLARPLTVSRAGIRNVQRKMKPAVRVPGVDGVAAFGRLVVAFYPFGSDRHSPQRDLIG